PRAWRTRRASNGGTGSCGRSGTSVDMRLILAGVIGMSYAAAQHPIVYEDARVRILNVQNEPSETTRPHRHAADHLWIVDSEIHFSRGGVTHVERNRELIIEMLQPQTNPHNVCGE